MEIPESVYRCKDLVDVWTHRLQSVTLYVTNKCNSRCEICDIWKQEPKVDMPIDVIEKILGDRSIRKDCFFYLTGGEVFLHPQHDQMFSLFNKYNRKYMLLSNGILWKKLIEAVKKYRIKSVYLSLDGDREGYKRVRGVDAYDNVIKAIKGLSEITSVRVAYTINPWNTPEDLKHVIKICRDEGVVFNGVGVYTRTPFLQAGIEPSLDMLEGYAVKDFEPLCLYRRWQAGLVKVPCWNISVSCTVNENCDVYMCQEKEEILGNVKSRTLGEIWRSEKTKTLHHKYRNCNDCWLGCQRPFDISLAQFLRYKF
ncbi:MAG: radical SAM protein [Deltaproteobacteria bacterium]|nr:radical SAM protein [Deltaproteobacteria bacterium]